MPSADSMQAFHIKQNNFHECRYVETALPAIGPGQLLLKVDSFAFSANNITYAAYGDILGYWHFYPQSGGWGQIPVWGFADVIESAVDSVGIGERLFGYWPMASHAVLTPKAVEADTLVEGAESRQALNAFYNRYTRCAADPGYRSDQEDWQSIFRPLGLTAFLMDEYLAEHQFWDAEATIVSSASSKTSISVAHYLHQRGACKVVGLTSAQHLDFVEQLGCYDEVVEYGLIESLPQERPSIFVDMSGNGMVQMSVHQHLGANLKQSVSVGGTHWTEIRPGLALPGPTPEFFFAPDHILQRLSSWGPQDFGARFREAWISLMPRVQSGIQIVRSEGQAATEDVYRAFLEGTPSANKGYILSL